MDLPVELVEAVCSQLDARSLVHMAVACSGSPHWNHVYSVVVSRPLRLGCGPLPQADILSFSELETVLCHFADVFIEVGVRSCCLGSNCIYGHMVSVEAAEVDAIIYLYRHRVSGIRWDYIYEFTPTSVPHIVKEARFFDASLDILDSLSSLTSLELVGYSHSFFKLGSLETVTYVRIYTPGKYYDSTCTVLLPPGIKTLVLDHTQATVWTRNAPFLSRLEILQSDLRWEPEPLLQLETVVFRGPGSSSIDSVLRMAPRLKYLDVSGLKQLGVVPPLITVFKASDMAATVLEQVEFPAKLVELSLDVDSSQVLDLKVLGPQLERVHVINGDVVNMPLSVTSLTVDKPFKSDFYGLQWLKLVGYQFEGTCNLASVPVSTLEVVGTKYTAIDGLPKTSSMTISGNSELLRIPPVFSEELAVFNNPQLSPFVVESARKVKITHALITLPMTTVDMDIDWDTVVLDSLPPNITKLTISSKALAQYPQLPRLSSLHINVNTKTVDVPVLPSTLYWLRIGEIDTHNFRHHHHNQSSPLLCNDLTTMLGPLTRVNTVEIIGMKLLQAPIVLPSTIKLLGLNHCQLDSVMLHHHHLLDRLSLIGCHHSEGGFTRWTWESVGAVSIVDTSGLPATAAIPDHSNPHWNQEWWSSVMETAPPPVKAVRHEQFWFEPGKGTGHAYTEWTRQRPQQCQLLWSHC